MATDDIEEAHRLAIRLNQNTYEDPVTKYQVFTSKCLESRGSCCGFKCRHCPYGHFAVQPPNGRINVIQRAILINASKKKYELNNCDFMVYNGDKESITMLVNHEQERKYAKIADGRDERALILIVLVDEQTGNLITSKAHSYDIFDQCKQLKLPLYALPCAPANDICAVLEDGLMALDMEKSNRKVYVPSGFPVMSGLSADRFTYTYPSQRLDDADHEKIQEIIHQEARYSIFGVK